MIIRPITINQKFLVAVAPHIFCPSCFPRSTDGLDWNEDHYLSKIPDYVRTYRAVHQDISFCHSACFQSTECPTQHPKTINRLKPSKKVCKGTKQSKFSNVEISTKNYLRESANIFHFMGVRMNTIWSISDRFSPRKANLQMNEAEIFQNLKEPIELICRKNTCNIFFATSQNLPPSLFWIVAMQAVIIQENIFEKNST